MSSQAEKVNRTALRKELARVQEQLDDTADSIAESLRSVHFLYLVLNVLGLGVLLTLSIVLYIKGEYGFSLMTASVFIMALPFSIWVVLQNGRPLWNYLHRRTMLKNRVTELHAAITTAMSDPTLPVITPSEIAETDPYPEEGEEDEEPPESDPFTVAPRQRRRPRVTQEIQTAPYAVEPEGDARRGATMLFVIVGVIVSLFALGIIVGSLS